MHACAQAGQTLGKQIAAVGVAGNVAERDTEWIEWIAGQQMPAVVGRIRSRRGVLPARGGSVVERVGKERYLVVQLIIAEQEGVDTPLLRHDVGELVEVVAVLGAVVAAVVTQAGTVARSLGDLSLIRITETTRRTPLTSAVL